jgi:hypothetical protein
MRRLLAMSDFWSGILFAAVGAAGLWIGRGYPRGTLSEMGPGFFPRAISVVLIAIGMIIIFQAVRARGAVERLGSWPWRALVTVLGGMILFGALAPVLGMVVAAGVVIILPGFATSETKPFELMVFAAVLVTFSVLVFVYGLGVNFRIFPWS